MDEGKLEELFRDWSAQMRKIEERLSPPSLAWFSVREVAQRLLQIFQDKGIKQYSRLFFERVHSGLSTIPPVGSRLDLGEFFISSMQGELVLSDSGLITARNSIREAIHYWKAILRGLIKGVKLSPTLRVPGCTIVWGMSLSEVISTGSDPQRFAEFCRGGPIPPLNDAELLLIVGNEAEETSDSRIKFTGDPVLYLAGNAKISLIRRLQAIILHAYVLVVLLIQYKRQPLIAFVAQDLVGAALIRTLDRAGVIQSMVVTNSFLANDRLWQRGKGRRFLLNRVYYSQNGRCMRYKGQESAFYPALSYIHADIQWVWTDGFAQFLRDAGFACPIKIVGPILFYLPGRKLVSQSSEKNVRIAVFDVTPVSPESARRLGLFGIYYTRETMHDFVTEIARTFSDLFRSSELHVELFLKHKRRPNRDLHDNDYLDSISDVAYHRVELNFVEPQSSLFDFVQNKDLLISIPFTSTAILGPLYDIPSIYFDPTLRLEQDPYIDPGIEFCSGQAELRATVSRIFSNVLGESKVI